ncbi:MAG TPA: DUF4838 domain-containing protein [Candidatus Binataceae bacterium]|jgi:hypothetical protein|nr:DUF4838 domain-containing protein [Candidatus Binataceae bacterium]
MTRAARDLCGVRIGHAPVAGELVRFAARELAAGLGAMLGEAVGVEAVAGLDARSLLIEGEAAARSAGASPSTAAPFAAQPRADAPSSGSAARERAALPDDGFAHDSFGLERGSPPGAPGAGRRAALLVEGGSERAALHAAYDLLERLGARFALNWAPVFPPIELGRLAALAPYRVAPAFERRAFVSDIMTWHYEDAERLRMHLEHDREFVPWMARRGINAFSYIRHAQDTRLKIDELSPMLSGRGIGAEYGGHVLELLLPRELFASHPEYFPCGEDQRRMERGNLCVSSRAALECVRAGALGYVRDNREMTMLHIWGADVWSGAWCRCGGCAAFSPQLQYMKVVNEIAAALAAEGDAVPPVAYLAYHDTLEPDPALRPLGNVWFEWAPRERCYSHAIDDPACTVNPRHLESLKRYIDLFDGRGGVFEYYADAVLFGGMGFATPSVIVRDLRAYHRMGLRSISCLTFGAFSALAYPVNLETFARTTRSLDLDPDTTVDDIAMARYPGCSAAMAGAYRTIAKASAMALTYGDVLRPPSELAGAPQRRARLLDAAASMRDAIAAAEAIVGEAMRDATVRPEVGAQRDLWEYSAEALEGVAQWLEARTLAGAERTAMGAQAIEKVDRAIRHVRAVGPVLKGTWGAYDLERSHGIWLEGLRRRLEE